MLFVSCCMPLDALETTIAHIHATGVVHLRQADKAIAVTDEHLTCDSAAIAQATSHAVPPDIANACNVSMACMLKDGLTVCRLVAEDDPWANRIEFLMEVMVSTYERRRFQTEVINELPLYPTEAILWDENQVPDVHYTGQL